eukprot:g25705.t1
MVFSLHQFLFTMYGLPAETHRRKPEDERKTHRRALATNEAHSPVEPVKALRLNDALFADHDARLANASFLPPPGLAPPGLSLMPRKTPSVISDELSTQLRDDGSYASFVDSQSQISYSASQVSFSSRVSEDLRTLASMGLCECKLLEDDLRHFSAVLLSRMSSACVALRKVDEELAVADEQTELVTSAESLANELVFVSQEMLPALVSDPLGALGLAGYQAAQDKREIFSELGYVAKCVEAVWGNSLDMVAPAEESNNLEIGLNCLNDAAEARQHGGPRLTAHAILDPKIPSSDCQNNGVFLSTFVSCREMPTYANLVNAKFD